MTVKIVTQVIYRTFKEGNKELLHFNFCINEETVNLYRVK